MIGTGADEIVAPGQPAPGIAAIQDPAAEADNRGSIRNGLKCSASVEFTLGSAGFHLHFAKVSRAAQYGCRDQPAAGRPFAGGAATPGGPFGTVKRRHFDEKRDSFFARGSIVTDEMRLREFPPVITRAPP